MKRNVGAAAALWLYIAERLSLSVQGITCSGTNLLPGLPAYATLTVDCNRGLVSWSVHDVVDYITVESHCGNVTKTITYNNNGRNADESVSYLPLTEPGAVCVFKACYKAAVLGYNVYQVQDQTCTAVLPSTSTTSIFQLSTHMEEVLLSSSTTSIFELSTHMEEVLPRSSTTSFLLSTHMEQILPSSSIKDSMSSTPLSQQLRTHASNEYSMLTSTQTTNPSAIPPDVGTPDLLVVVGVPLAIVFVMFMILSLVALTLSILAIKKRNVPKAVDIEFQIVSEATIKQNLEILHQGELSTWGSWHTIIQPLQLCEQEEMETLSVKTTFIDEDCFDMTIPELSKSYILDDHNGIDKENDDHDMDGKEIDLCSTSSASLQDMDITQQSESECEAAPVNSTKPIEISPSHKTPMNALVESSGYLANDSMQYIRSPESFSDAGVMQSLPKYMDTGTTWNTETYVPEPEDYDDFSLCSQ